MANPSQRVMAGRYRVADFVHLKAVVEMDGRLRRVVPYCTSLHPVYHHVESAHFDADGVDVLADVVARSAELRVGEVGKQRSSRTASRVVDTSFIARADALGQ